jgi:hypothetical protein
MGPLQQPSLGAASNTRDLFFAYGTWAEGVSVNSDQLDLLIKELRPQAQKKARSRTRRPTKFDAAAAALRAMLRGLTLSSRPRFFCRPRPQRLCPAGRGQTFGKDLRGSTAGTFARCGRQVP